MTPATDPKPAAPVAHSPLPWSVNLGSEIVNSQGDRLAVAHYLQKPNGDTTHDDANEANANAAYIVAACNAHPALIDALELCSRNVGTMLDMLAVKDESQRKIFTAWKNRIDAALKQGGA